MVLPIMINRAGITWDPWDEMGQLQQAVNQLFSDYTCTPSDFPSVNVMANDNESVVTAEVPGIDPKDVSLTVSGNTLAIEGERKPETAQAGTVYHRQERGFGKFSRAIRLPYEVESNAVKATFSHGVLRIALPRKESSKPRRIEVQAE